MMMKKEKKEIHIDANALAYLRTRSIYVATPCFGGHLSYSYTSSLLGLVNICSELKIKCVVSFQPNESLISRARNFMVGKFLETNCTDFFFIDADIGFDPKDVIHFLLRDEEIIGVPYPRKHFNWARLVDCLKRHNFDIPFEDINKLTSDCVFNFFPDSRPTGIDLREMIEVQDAGTGLMRIKRGVFGKIREAFPNRVYMSTWGDNSSNPGVPTYMYFQPEIDPDHVVGSHPLPNYLSEDYAFCHLARKAGLKVHIAPWVKTSHVGTCTFQGDLETVARFADEF